MRSSDLKNKNIIFFDGVCHLCNSFVDEVISKDAHHFFQFAPLQGETAKELLSEHERNSLESVIYYQAGPVYRKSTAVLRVIGKLGGLYRLSFIGYIVPTFIRDAIYTLIAKNRYSWFGERDVCRLPTADERSYLLP